MQSLQCHDFAVFVQYHGIVFIVFTSKFVVEIQNLIYLLRFVKYNLEPYGSNIAIYRICLYFHFDLG